MKGTSVPGSSMRGSSVRKAPGTGGSTTGRKGSATVPRRSADLAESLAPTRRAPAFTRSSLGVARR